MRVVVDAGHGGRDRFNVGPTGYVEADGTLAMALTVAQNLQAAGVQVKLVRDCDTDLAPKDQEYSQVADLSARTAIANNWPADLYVSIHTNAGPSAARGTETWAQMNRVDSQNLARLIQASLCADCGTESRGVRYRDDDTEEIFPDGQQPAPNTGHRDYYHVLRVPQCTSVLVEVAYHSNPDDEALLKTPAFLDKAGQSIAGAILKWANISPDHVPTWAAASVAKAQRIVASRDVPALDFAEEGMDMCRLVTVLDKLGLLK